MRRLVCVCGAVVEGSEEELLEAVERHLAEAHLAARPPQSAQLRVGLETACTRDRPERANGRSDAETEET